jgi:hypothetical protein
VFRLGCVIDRAGTGHQRRHLHPGGTASSTGHRQLLACQIDQVSARANASAGANPADDTSDGSPNVADRNAAACDSCTHEMPFLSARIGSEAVPILLPYKGILIPRPADHLNLHGGSGLSESTTASGTDWALGVEARSRALLNEGDTADRLYREAIERLSRTRMGAELARAHLVHGEWLRRENRRAEAREQLRSAYQILTAMGMEGFADRARRELLATGETVRKRTV